MKQFVTRRVLSIGERDAPTMEDGSPTVAADSKIDPDIGLRSVDGGRNMGRVSFDVFQPNALAGTGR